MENSSLRRNLKNDESAFLGRKRSSKDLSENFLFRQSLTGLLEGDYEITANIFRSFLAFDWDDEKIVKNKLHPSKIFIFINIVLNLDASSFWFFINSMYYPHYFEEVKEKKDKIYSAFLSLVNKIALSKPILKKNFKPTLKDIFLNDIKTCILESGEEDEEAENIADYFVCNLTKNCVDSKPETLSINFPENLNNNLRIPESQKIKINQPHNFDKATAVDEIIEKLTEKLNKIEEKNVKSFDRLKNKIEQNEDGEDTALHPIKLGNISPPKVKFPILSDFLLTSKEKEDYFKYLSKKHEEKKKKYFGRKIFQNFKEELAEYYLDDGIDDGINCLVCNDGVHEENEMVETCSKCQVATHASCYGEIDLNTEEWICKACEMHPDEELSCVLCPVKGGVMKQCDLNINSNFYQWIINLRSKEKSNSGLKNLPPSPTGLNSSLGSTSISSLKTLPDDSFSSSSCVTNNTLNIHNQAENKKNSNSNKLSWVHLSCALWIPEIHIEDFTNKENIMGVEFIDKARFKEVCNICKLSNYGPTLKCNHENCTFRFHVECGRINHYCLEVINLNGTLNYNAYCNHHRPNKLIQQIETRNYNISEQIKTFTGILKKINVNYEKEYQTSLSYSVPGLNKQSKKNVKLKISQAHKNSNAIKNNKTQSKSNKLIDIKKTSPQERSSFISQLKYVCKLFSCYNTVTIKKTKLNETTSSNKNKKTLSLSNYSLSLDPNSFKNKLRYLDVRDNDKFPWSMIKLENYKESQMKRIFKYLIPNEDVYNRVILKRKVKHKEKEKVGAKEGSDIMIAIEEEGPEEEDDLNLYCYCLKKYSKDAFWIGCDNDSKCVGAYEGWFHHQCVEELKNIDEETLKAKDFSFLCKECLQKEQMQN